MYKIFQTDRYKKWFQKLRDTRAKFVIGQRLERMTLGNFGDSKSVGDTVYELRIDIGKGYRIYFSNIKKEIILLLVGGDKSTQEKDIKTAKRIAKEFQHEKNNKI